MKYLSAILLFVLFLPLCAEAQTAQSGGAKVTAEIIASSSTAVVKNSPFSAEAISESVQTLADGNKITRSVTTRMFRDGDGRFRREGGSTTGGGNIISSGSVAVSGYGFGSQDAISIFDPVSNVRYLINPSTKTVRRMNTIHGAAEGAVIVNGHSMSHAVKTRIETNAVKQTQVVVLPSFAATVVGGANNGGAGKTESLGTRNFEGVEAEGTRTVTTIAAGTIGNEREIEMVYERWHSKELQLIVYSKHTDPRFGEQIYRLVNINRNEPDRSLFTPPADYKVVAEPAFNVVTTKPR